MRPVRGVTEFIEPLQSARVILVVFADDDQKDVDYILEPAAILERSSTWFEKALRPDGFREGQEDLIRFSVSDHEACKLFVYWAYHDHRLLQQVYGTATKDAEAYMCMLASGWIFEPLAT